MSDDAPAQILSALFILALIWIALDDYTGDD